jgi:hypothetical protein
MLPFFTRSVFCCRLRYTPMLAVKDRMRTAGPLDLDAVMVASICARPALSLSPITIRSGRAASPDFAECHVDSPAFARPRFLSTNACNSATLRPTGPAAAGACGDDAVGMLLRPARIAGTAPVITSATLTSQAKNANAERVVDMLVRHCAAAALARGVSFAIRAPILISSAVHPQKDNRYRPFKVVGFAHFLVLPAFFLICRALRLVAGSHCRHSVNQRQLATFASTS